RRRRTPSSSSARAGRPSSTTFGVMSPALDKAQVSHFQERGWLLLPRALGAAVVGPARAYVLDELKRQGFWAGGRSLSRRLRDVPMFQQIGRLGQAIRYPALGERLMTPALRQAVSRLAGVAPPRVPEAQLLISLPHGAPWTL